MEYDVVGKESYIDYCCGTVDTMFLDKRSIMKDEIYKDNFKYKFCIIVSHI